MRLADLFGHQFTVGLQTCDVSLDGLDCPGPALLNRAATGEAARQCRNGDIEAAARLRLDHDRVGTHRLPSCHSTPRRSSTLRPAWFMIDRSKPGPIVSPACNGTVTRPPRTGCLSWACEPLWTTTTQPSLDNARTNSRPVTRGIGGMEATVDGPTDSNGPPG